MIDEKDKSQHNKEKLPLAIDDSGEYIKINKKDLVWTNTGNHTHHYLPDFTDEWDKAIALKCVVEGCIHGRVVKKEGKFLKNWLETHRTKS